MDNNINNIVQNIFQVESFEDLSLKQLREFAEQYPSFNFAHYMLTKKLQLENSNVLENEIHKTALYFTNPFWLKWLLQQPDKKPEAGEQKEDPSTPENHFVENITNKTAEVVATEEKAEPIVSKQEEAIIFEPYHTIDYFASQGIKITQEENPNDKFGRQLKSFTEWLKTMKKLPRQTAEIEAEPEQDAAIEDFASHSIEEKEVLTETMAEVLVKQGRNERAIELYHKLSLLNPAKNAYFAAKIEHLK